MNYINPATREIVSFAELRVRYPATSLPEGAEIIQMEEVTYALLIEDTRPDVNDYQIVVAGKPVLRSNQWRYTWEISAKPLEDRIQLADWAIDTAIDAQAVALDFKDMTDAASYVASSNADWAAQAQALVHWRDEVWAGFEVMKAAARAGQGLPLPADVVLALPQFSYQAGGA